MIFCDFPMAIRTCFTRTVMIRIRGSMRTMITPRTGGIATMDSPSSSYSLHFFSAYFLAEFCFKFCNWLCQPPSILPTSFSFSERRIYFLSSIDFVSQRIIRNILSVSVFLIANLIQGNFSCSCKNPDVVVASIASTKRLSIFCPKEYLWVFGILIKNSYQTR